MGLRGNQKQLLLNSFTQKSQVKEYMVQIGLMETFGHLMDDNDRLRIAVLDFDVRLMKFGWLK